MTKGKIILIFLILILGCGPSDDDPLDSNLYPYSDKENLNNWILIEDLSDEFDGATVNSNRWVTLYPGWNGRHPSWFVSNNTSIKNNELNITMKKERLPEMDEGYVYSTGVIRSLVPFKYGYCEIKAKCMKSAGSSAFFLNNVQADWWTEIDVFEIGGNAAGHEYLIHTNLHEFYNPENVNNHFVIDETTHYSDPEILSSNWRPDGDYHIYGIEWNNNEIKWYVDGQLIRETPNIKWHQEQYVNIDSEVMIDWLGLPDDNDLPSTFHIDYVRTWQRE